MGYRLVSNLYRNTGIVHVDINRLKIKKRVLKHYTIPCVDGKCTTDRQLELRRLAITEIKKEISKWEAKKE
jgi:hypothetical protein